MVKEHIKLGIQEHFIGTKGAIGGLRQSNTQRGKHQDTLAGFSKKLKTNPSARLDTKKLRDPAGLDPDGKKPTGNNEMVPTGLVEKTDHILNRNTNHGCFDTLLSLDWLRMFWRKMLFGKRVRILRRAQRTTLTCTLIVAMTPNTSFWRWRTKMATKQCR